jgi:hypothetical protein
MLEWWPDSLKIEQTSLVARRVVGGRLQSKEKKAFHSELLGLAMSSRVAPKIG